jgi:ATP-dependent Clp protease adapter protein ClpS
MRSFTILGLLSLLCSSAMAFTFMAPPTQRSIGISTPAKSSSAWTTSSISSNNRLGSDQSKLYMSSTEKSRTTKKTTIVKDRVETKPDEAKNKEELWRVVLHNDEVHTFNYVVRSLCKVIGTLDRKAAFEICVQTHGVGKATITKSWKKQAEAFCLGMQRRKWSVVFQSCFSRACYIVMDAHRSLSDFLGGCF